jgi:thiol:disulfide interchange protein DsbD
MLPGMWGAPLKAISGYLPPMQTQDFVLGTGSVSISENTKKSSKYSDFLKFPPEFQFKEYYFTIDEAIARSKEIGKPIFVDFTGHSCPNCREMEQKIWSDPRVKQLLTDEFIVVALYGDDKTKVAESDWITTDKGKVVKELGKINQLYMLNRFGQNGMPLYFIINEDNTLMTDIHSHDLNVDNYLKFMTEGLNNYKKQLNK